LQQPYISGSIVLETKLVGKIQGVQIEGCLITATGELLHEIKTVYTKRFPFTLLMNTTFWLLELQTIKMTDNRLGFGKKLYWQRNPNCNNIN
jgi:uncharacterized protein YhbP (UPF0306 family)